MRIALWLVFALLATLWTAVAYLVAHLGQTLAKAASAGSTANLTSALLESPPMLLLVKWLDPHRFQAVQDSLLWLLESLGKALPHVGSALAWVAPVSWGLWALVMLPLLGLTALAHVLLGRVPKPPPSTP